MRIPGLKTIKRSLKWVRARVGGGAMILGYHRVADNASDGYNIGVTPAHFGEHLEILRKYTHPMPLVELTAHLKRGTLPRNAVAVTFDDGYADNLYNALPLLKSYQIPSTVFVCTEYLGQAFWWDELEWLIQSPLVLPDALELNVSGKSFEWHASRSNRVELLNSLHRYLFSMDFRERSDMIATIRRWSGAASYEPAGHRALTPDELVQLAVRGLVEIGSHTRTHPVLSSLPVEKQRTEIASSRTQLEWILNRPVVGFAYPNGAFTSETCEIVRESGFQYACSSKIDLVRDPSFMYELPRFWPTDGDGNQFLRMLKIWLRI